MMNDDGKWCDIQRQIDHYYRHNNMQNNARSNLCVCMCRGCVPDDLPYQHKFRNIFLFKFYLFKASQATTVTPKPTH